MGDTETMSAIYGSPEWQRKRKKLAAKLEQETIRHNADPKVTELARLEKDVVDAAMMLIDLVVKPGREQQLNVTDAAGVVGNLEAACDALNAALKRQAKKP